MNTENLLKQILHPNNLNPVSYTHLDVYKRQFSNNGGQYNSSSLDKAFDNNLSTHWETGTKNTSSFINEVIIEFNQIKSIDRIVYATRQDVAKGKGFPNEFEIYASLSGEDDDFRLAVTGSHTTTGNMMEFKFDTIQAKKIKFVFKIGRAHV